MKSQSNGIKSLNNTNDLPPFYPNEWILILESRNTKINQIKPIINFGCGLTIFRGISDEDYVSGAFFLI